MTTDNKLKVYRDAWLRVKDEELDKKTSWGKEELKRLMDKVLLEVIGATPVMVEQSLSAEHYIESLRELDLDSLLEQLDFRDGHGDLEGVTCVARTMADRLFHLRDIISNFYGLTPDLCHRIRTDLKIGCVEGRL